MVRQLKKLCTGLLFSVIVGCATYSPPKLTGELTTTVFAKETALLMDKQAVNCWTREFLFSQDGILVDSRKIANESYLISAARYNLGSGLLSPFLIIKIYARNGLTRLEINEGDYMCSFAECSRLNLTSDIVRWVAGDLTCSTKVLR